MCGVAGAFVQMAAETSRARFSSASAVGPPLRPIPCAIDFSPTILPRPESALGSASDPHWVPRDGPEVLTEGRQISEIFLKTHLQSAGQPEKTSNYERIGANTCFGAER
jgi:hypothetical protein